MARSKRPSRSRRIRATAAVVEHLETRQMLTGNVTASVRNDNLVLLGDGDDNQFEVTHFGGNIAVRPLNDTTINGEAELFVAFANTDTIPGNLVVRPAGGDDSVIISRDLTVAGNLTVQTGAGNDNLGILRATIIGETIVTMGSGQDGISIEGATLGTATILRGNNGRDSFGITNSDFAGTVFVTTGGGNDGLLLDGVTVGGAAEFETGDDQDGVAIGGTEFADDLIITTNTGDDALQLLDSRFEGTTFIGVGADADDLALGASGLRNVFVGDFEANGSGGENTYDQQNNVFQAGRIVERFDEGPADLSIVENRVERIDTVQAAIAELFVYRERDLTGTPENSEASVGAFITKATTIQLTGQSSNDAFVEIDTDGDGEFDETTQANEFGSYDFQVPLAIGLQTIAVRATDETGTETTFDVAIHRAIGSIARFETSYGFFDVELLDDDAPQTVQNYKSYFDAYEHSFVHRVSHFDSGDPFVVQGGGFQYVDGSVSQIPPNVPVQNEFNAANSNLRGTLSTALSNNNPDSATNQWFINLSDNSFLDDAQHVVFGRVIADGLDIVDQITATPVFNLDGGALTETPLRDFELFSEQISGSLSTTADSTTVTGTDTLFTEELTVGQTLRIQDSDGAIVGTYQVTAIVSDTELIVSLDVPSTETNAGGFEHPTLSEEHFVFSDIDEILASI